MKMNAAGIPCDLVTGEERLFALDNMNPSPHLSSTVEMLSPSMEVEVAIIDEIQMIRDEQRGWAFTRALLGVAASEVSFRNFDILTPAFDRLSNYLI